MNIFRKFSKHKYIKVLIFLILLTVAFIILHDLFVKRFCGSHVMENYSYKENIDGEGPYIYFPNGKDEALDSIFKDEFYESKNFISLEAAEKYCFAKKKLF